ncbi:hypothetical protein NN561_013411 [Cricetulus griseus]
MNERFVPQQRGPRWRQSGQQGLLAPAAGSERVGKRLRGLAAVLLGRVSPSLRQICHPYAQDHNRISSIRPGKEAFKLLILCRGAMTALPRISSVGSTETNLGRGGRVQKEPNRSEKYENTGGYSRGGSLVGKCQQKGRQRGAHGGALELVGRWDLFLIHYFLHVVSRSFPKGSLQQRQIDAFFTLA